MIGDSGDPRHPRRRGVCPFTSEKLWVRHLTGTEPAKSSRRVGISENWWGVAEDGEQWQHSVFLEGSSFVDVFLLILSCSQAHVGTCSQRPAFLASLVGKVEDCFACCGAADPDATFKSCAC